MPTVPARADDVGVPKRELGGFGTAKLHRGEAPALELQLPEGALVPLNRAVRIGQSAHGNDVVLADQAVSRHHCVIEVRQDSPLLRDLRSTNGTLLNGVPIEAAELRGPVSLRVGHTELRVIRRGLSLVGHPLIGESACMQTLRQQIDTLSRTCLPVLIFGETGSGKELVARALHDRGERRGGPFVPLNCGSLPEELIESELFGHERGAFTGAATKRPGMFLAADEGTLFLDEIGELPLPLQPRLLRALESGRVRPVGAEREVAVDVRVVAASHVDLRSAVRQRRFRQDLYYRLAGVVLTVPPLRERMEDLPALTEHLLHGLATGKKFCTLSDAAQAALLSHSWPGNVRELRNVLGRAVALGGPHIDVHDLGLTAEHLPLARPFAAIERELITEALQKYGGHRRAAAALGIPKSTLCDKVRRYQIGTAR